MLYLIVLVSAIHHHESAIGVHMHGVYFLPSSPIHNLRGSPQEQNEVESASFISQARTPRLSEVRVRPG